MKKINKGYWVWKYVIKSFAVYAVIKNIDTTKKVSVITYVDQQEAYKRFISQLSGNFASLKQGIDPSILPPSLEVKAYSLPQLDKIAGKVYSIKDPGGKINSIIYYKQVVSNIESFLSVVKVAGAALIIFLVAVSLVIVLVTIGISINSHATEIEIMQLVGASRNYIRLPYILDGAFYGIVGVFFSSVLIGLIVLFSTKIDTNIYYAVLSFFRNIPMPDFSLKVILEGLGIEIVCGAILGGVGSLISLAKYLK